MTSARNTFALSMIALLLRASAVRAAPPALTTAPADAVVVEVDPSIVFQSIDGFGAFGCRRNPWEPPPLADPAFCKALVDDLGVTILRVEVPVNFGMNGAVIGDRGREPHAGLFDDGKGGVDLAKLNVGRAFADMHQTTLFQWAGYIKMLAAQSKRSGEPLKIIATVWSPPPWMKYTNSVGASDRVWNRLSDGTHALPDYYPDLGELCEGYVCLFKQECGEDLYGLSVQNEPAFTESYQSCVYSPSQLKRATDLVAKRLRDAKLPTKLYGPEDVTEPFRVAEFIETQCGDEAGRRAIDILAVHGYADDGVRANDPTSSQWAAPAELARRFNKPLWMTETSGYKPGWPGAMNLAKNLHYALADGNVSAWVWWQANAETRDGPEKADSCLLRGGSRLTDLGRVSRQYYRFVRPGAVRVLAKSAAGGVFVTAFSHEANKTLTLVVVNEDDAHAKSIRFDVRSLGPQASQLKVISSTSSGTAEAELVSWGDALSVPPQSVTTVVADGVAVVPPRAANDPLTIREQPRDGSANEGEAISFAVAPNLPFPYDATFQWKRNGQPIVGATLPAFSHSGTSASDDGVAYSVDVTRGGTTVTSKPAIAHVGAFHGLKIAKASAAPTIDGEIDVAWQNATAAPLGHAISGKVDGPIDCSATVRTMWDEQNLYLLYDVTDDVLQVGGAPAGTNAAGKPTPAKASFLADAVELYVDADNAKARAYGPHDFQFVVNADSNVIEETKRADTTGARAATARRQGGYRVELAIPLKLLGVTPAPGKFIGLEAQVNDADAPGVRKSKLALFGDRDDVWQSPAKMGTAKLE